MIVLMYCYSCWPRCNFSSQDSMRVYTKSYRLYEERSIDLLERRSVCLFQETEARPEWYPRAAMDCKMEDPTNGRGTTDFNFNNKRSSTTYHTAQSEPFHFSNTPLLLFHHLLSTYRVFHPLHSL